jgi:hypothetical protein
MKNFSRGFLLLPRRAGCNLQRQTSSARLSNLANIFLAHNLCGSMYIYLTHAQQDVVTSEAKLFSQLLERVHCLGAGTEVINIGKFQTGTY